MIWIVETTALYHKANTNKLIFTIIVLLLNSSIIQDLPTSCPAPLERDNEIQLHNTHTFFGLGFKPFTMNLGLFQHANMGLTLLKTQGAWSIFLLTLPSLDLLFIQLKKLNYLIHAGYDFILPGWRVFSKTFTFNTAT